MVEDPSAGLQLPSVKVEMDGRMIDSDTITADDFFTLKPNELWLMSDQYRDTVQLTLLSDRFDNLNGRVGQLAKLSKLQGISRIRSLDDAAPLLFQHTVYKSYPMSLVEKGRFDLLTRWLDGLTVHDLSGVDVSGCSGFDSWFDALEAQTPLRPNHSTGTSGKLSIIPRDTKDLERFELNHLRQMDPFGSEPDRMAAIRAGNAPIPIVYPSSRHGRHVAQRMLDGLVRRMGSEATTYVLYDDFLSADVASLAGRVRGASMKGTLEDMKIAPGLLGLYRASLERQSAQANDQERFFERVLADLVGENAFVFGNVPLLYAWTEMGEARGLKSLFGAGSSITSGGGLKGSEVPADWRVRIEAFLGAPIRLGYGMSELIAGAAECPHGVYHLSPFTIPFILDPATGAPLPRSGTQTGRFAFFDLLVESYWGGFVTGDKVTMTWGGCECGRKGPYFDPLIERFSELEGGDDKISCSGSNDAHEEAMAWLASKASELG